MCMWNQRCDYRNGVWWLWYLFPSCCNCYTRVIVAHLTPVMTLVMRVQRGGQEAVCLGAGGSYPLLFTLSAYPWAVWSLLTSLDPRVYRHFLGAANILYKGEWRSELYIMMRPRHAVLSLLERIYFYNASVLFIWTKSKSRWIYIENRKSPVEYIFHDEKSRKNVQQYTISCVARCKWHKNIHVKIKNESSPRTQI